MTDAEVVSDEIEGYVTGLLGLVGVDADPLSSREHILLSNLINHSWTEGRPLDLMTLVGMIATPPIRKLGVFELDQFFPEADRMKLAMQLNGLLASPSFAAWAAGPPLDIDSMLFTPEGTPRCAIITTAHLSDEERQFVTSLVLSKLVTWMRRQSGTTDLRAMLYMDEVAGYLPPTANPPTKKPIMLLMKQARAFGVGVVLSTQNPVDIDYKAISNAGTWMIGRLQTDRDKARLLDGMSSAAGGVDVGADRRHDLGARQTRVHAPSSGPGPAGGVHHSLGDVVSAGPDDPRPDRPTDGRRARRGRGRRSTGTEQRCRRTADARARARHRPSRSWPTTRAPSCPTSPTAPPCAGPTWRHRGSPMSAVTRVGRSSRPLRSHA